MSFEAWLGKEITKHTRQYKSPINPKDIYTIKEWYKATNPDISKKTYSQALKKANRWIKRLNMHTPLKEFLNINDIDTNELINMINYVFTLPFGSQPVSENNITNISISESKMSSNIFGPFYIIQVEWIPEMYQESENPENPVNVKVLTKDGKQFNTVADIMLE